MNNPNENQEVSKVTWKADTTHPDLAAIFREKLREVIDPEIGLSVIELGLIRDLDIDDGMALMRMILTTPFCPYGPAMLEMARQKGEEALQRPVRIEMGMEMWDLSMMEEGAAGDWGLY